MKTKMLFALCFLLFALCSCSKESNYLDNNNSDVELEDRAKKRCYTCISEDLLGGLEGGLLGLRFGNAITAAVGAAVVGAYRSVREYNSQGLVSSGGYSSNYLDDIATQYDLEPSLDPYYYVGNVHNKLLHELILNQEPNWSVDDYYTYMIDLIDQDSFFFLHTEVEGFEDLIKDYMDDIDNNSVVSSLDSSSIVLVSTLDSLINLENKVSFLNGVDSLENLYSNDQIAIQTIATAYHSYHFWTLLQ